MKRIKIIAWLAAALVLVLAGYFIVSGLTAGQEGEAAADESISVLSLAAEEIDAISWENDAGKLSLEKDGDKWIYAADAALSVDQTVPEAMLDAACGLTATREITDYGALGDYGLDAPSCTIVLGAGDASTTLRIGDINEVTSQYYLTVNDGGAVYAVAEDIVSAFGKELNDLAAKEETPYMSDIHAVSVQNADGSITIDHVDDASSLTYSDSYEWFTDVDGTVRPLNSELVSELISGMNDLEWASLVTYKATESDLAEYGLASPAATITFNYTVSESTATGEKDEGGNDTYTTTSANAVFELQLGGYSGDYCYARIAGSSMVYLIDADVADLYTHTGYDMLCADDICLMDWDTVDAIDITIDGETSTLTLSRTASEDADGSEITTTAYSLSGVSIETAAAETFLNGVAALTSTGEAASGTTPKDAEIALTFHRNTDNFAEMTLLLSRYDNSSYLVEFNGEARLLISRDDADALRDNFAAMK